MSTVRRTVLAATLPLLCMTGSGLGLGFGLEFGLLGGHEVCPVGPGGAAALKLKARSRMTGGIASLAVNEDVDMIEPGKENQDPLLLAVTHEMDYPHFGKHLGSPPQSECRKRRRDVANETALEPLPQRQRFAE